MLAVQTPYDGPAATVEEMDDAIGTLFGSS